MGKIEVGAYHIYIENRNGVECAICPNCGSYMNFRQLQTVNPSAETGFFYCSEDCVKEHVGKEMEEASE